MEPYIVISADNIEELKRLVCVAIGHGYIPQGGMCANGNYHRLYQAMILDVKRSSNHVTFLEGLAMK